MNSMQLLLSMHTFSREEPRRQSISCLNPWAMDLSKQAKEEHQLQFTATWQPPCPHPSLPSSSENGVQWQWRLEETQEEWVTWLCRQKQSTSSPKRLLEWSSPAWFGPPEPQSHVPIWDAVWYSAFASAWTWVASMIKGGMEGDHPSFNSVWL
jgi:hypothetical protein